MEGGERCSSGGDEKWLDSGKHGRRAIGVIGGLGVAVRFAWDLGLEKIPLLVLVIFSQIFSEHLLSEHSRTVCVLGSSWEEFGGKLTSFGLLGFLEEL